MKGLDHRAVFVEAHGRLHFGVLDLRGELGRWFGGIGTAAPGPTLLLSAYASDKIEVCGDNPAEVQRATEFARTFLAFHHLQRGVRLFLHRVLPAHCGLGSGTQLGLAVGRALATLYGITADASELSRAVGRAQRSAIGTWTFEGGGLVVEGGRRRNDERAAPLIARMAFPPSWECVVAVPNGKPGINGETESAAFAELPVPAAQEVEHVAHLVLLALLPALAEGDIDTFGAALTKIQATTGRWFAPVQGGAFAGPCAELIGRMHAWGAKGVGQSSWGPAVFGIVDGHEAATRLTDLVRGAMNGAGSVWHAPFPTHGALVWHTHARALTEVR
jgi:beta-RFAP synthase